MYCLEVIQSPSYQAGKQIKDNHNRDSSFCKSRSGFVIHSGVHRETAFISAVDHAEGHAAASYWFACGQLATNGFIEATIGDIGLDGCEQNALSKLLPDWTFRKIKGKRGALYRATRKSGKLVESIAGLSWQDLHRSIK